MEHPMEASASVANHDVQILSLDDACVRQVFQLLRLSDLCNIADVCRRFRTIATDVFQSLFGDEHTVDVMEQLHGNEIKAEWFMLRSIAQKFIISAEKLFRNFGPFIKAVRMTGTGEIGGMDENELMMLVKTYCPQLKELILVDFGCSDHFSTELQSLFGGLERLIVFDSGVSDSFVACLSNCYELKYLEVDYTLASLWMRHKFPKLETLVISKSLEFDDTEFESFLESHTELRTLKYCDVDISSTTIAILSKASHKLETFHCNVDEILDWHEDDLQTMEQDILELSKLKSLKRLTFTCEASTLKRLVVAFEKENTPIEHFELVHCRIDPELVTGLSKLKSMKTSKMSQCEMSEETLIHINEHLNFLNKIVLEDIKGIDLDRYKIERPFARNLCVMKTLVISPPNFDQEAHILNILNDDCLVDVFEYLPLKDLCNVADVCHRFQRNAQTAFQSKHKSFETNKLTEANDDGFRHIDIAMAEQLFRNFGSFIQELRLQGRFLKNPTDQEYIMYLADKYCRSTSFKTLTLMLDSISINTEMRWILPLLDLFWRLAKLQLHSCSLSGDFGKFLSGCHIPVIEICSPYGATDWMNNTFPNLRSLMMLDTCVSESAMIDFIKLNGHLQSLVIHESIFSSNIFQMVADHVPNLQVFYFSGRNRRDSNIRKNVLHLARLRSLKQLTLNCSSFSVKNLIDELSKMSTPLTDLSVCFGAVDMELLEKLCSFDSLLTSLEFRRVNMKNVSLIDIVKKMPNLQQLDVDIQGIVVNDIIKMLPFAEKLTKLTTGAERSNVQIGTDAFQSILTIVKCRRKAIKLWIEICSETPHVFVPKHLLIENSYWIHIKNEIIENYSITDSENESLTDELVEDSDEEEIEML